MHMTTIRLGWQATAGQTAFSVVLHQPNGSERISIANMCISACKSSLIGNSILQYKMVDVYIYDYLLKRNLQSTAKAFTAEGKVAADPVGNVSTTLQQIQARNQQTMDIKSEGNMGVAQRFLPMDPSSLYGQGIYPAKTWIGTEPRSMQSTFERLAINGIDQLRPNLGAQMQKSFLSTQSQFQLMSPQHQQQFLAQAQAQGNLSNSSNYVDLDPRRYTALSRGGLNGKDGQLAGTDGCISSPMQSSSPKVRSDQEYLMKVQQTSSQ